MISPLTSCDELLIIHLLEIFADRCLMHEQPESNATFRQSRSMPVIGDSNRRDPEPVYLRTDAPESAPSCENGICSLNWKPNRPA